MQKDNSSNSKRIVKNTLLLYVRTFFVMLISLFTSRVVLQTLGVEDYGIYNVVGGFVGMFSIISSSLVNASQRFISYEMGKEHPNSNKVFCGTVSVHILLVLLVFFLFETFGLWFVNTHLNISEDRMIAANWVYQCSIIAFCVNLLSVPYNATIIAHEKMSAFAYISILEVAAKLGIVYLLLISGYDKLIIYSILMLLVAVFIRVLYSSYCKRNFDECEFHFLLDKPFMRSLFGFIGWNFIGSTAGILVTQGVNILINIFFGVALNAARGIAEQVNNAINQFVGNFMTAMNPQITKSYSSGEYDYMNKLMERGAKYAALLLWLLSLPVFTEADFILKIWLVEVPPYAPIFLRLAIVFSIFQSLSNTLYIGMLATGRIKKYQIIMGGIYIASFLLCFLLFKFNFGPEWGYISTIMAVVVGAYARLILLKQMIVGFSIGSFVRNAILKAFLVIFSTGGCIYLIKTFVFEKSILFSIISIGVSLCLVPIMAYTLAIDNQEKTIIKSVVKKFVKKCKT